MFGLVVFSALTLAAAVNPNASHQQQRVVTRAPAALHTASYLRAIPAEHAASASMFRAVVVR